jgi:HEAT repeat protein
MVRGFAAAALGLIGASEAIEDLKSIINDDRLRAEQDLKAMSILSLGLMPKETHEDLVPFLLGLMESKNLNRIVRSQAPVSLGRLNALHGGSAAARAALSKVVSLFEADKTDNDLRRSLALCIGMLAEVGDTEAVDSMINAVQRSNDDQTRHFSIMALAEVGARDATPENHADTHNKLEQFFLRELTRPKRITHQPYGALGLAVYSRNENLQGASLRSAQKILEAFNNTNNPSYQGAMAISLGVLNYTVGQDDLWAKFDDSNDQPLKGYIAVSLGLMRATGKGEMMRALIKKKGLDSKFRLQLARALGLMSDTQAVPTLVDYLQNAETLAESSSSAQALGLIGDRNAIDPLLAIAKNPAKQELQRGFAAVALGIIAEKKDLPWNTVFSVNSNYRAKVPALSEILDIL